jgi:hypothetical protein
LAPLGVADIGPGRCFTVECKSVDPRANLDKAKAEHSYQTQVQLGLLREVTGYKPEFAVISYIDAAWWHEVKEYVTRFDPAVYAAAKMRARKIMEANAFDAFPPEGWISGGRECSYCPFTRQCGRERVAMPTSRAANPDPQVVAAARTLASTRPARLKPNRTKHECARPEWR